MDLVCNLNAMSADERLRHQVVWEQLSAAIQETQPLANGYRFRYPATAWMLAAEWVTRERLCCPFFHFALEIGGETLWLALSGDEDVKAFIKLEMDWHDPTIG